MIQVASTRLFWTHFSARGGRGGGGPFAVQCTRLRADELAFSTIWAPLGLLNFIFKFKPFRLPQKFGIKSLSMIVMVICSELFPPLCAVVLEAKTKGQRGAIERQCCGLTPEQRKSTLLPIDLRGSVPTPVSAAAAGSGRPRPVADTC